MNARFLSNVRVGLTVTALTIGGALMFSACASSSDGGGSGSGGSSGTGTGGSSGGGGAAQASGNTVTFKTGQAQGAMTGWGWVALGTLDTITDPTCDTAKAAITKATACTTTTNWNAPDALCINANIPALPSSPVQKDYDENWGVMVGLNSSDPPADKGGSTLGQTFDSITFNLSGSPITGLRGEIHIKGDDDNTVYCANIVSGRAVVLTDFNTKCWGDTTTVKLTSDKITNIDKVGVQVSSGSAAITVASLCLKSVSFGN